MGRTRKLETYISVDVEANGAIPGPYSMTSLGAVVVGDTDRTFYAELQPITDNVQPAAEAVSGLTLDYLKANGTGPAEAMQAFYDWVVESAGDTHRPVFVALNSSFDWMFVTWYLMTYVGQNPFGSGGLDMKAFYMAVFGVAWQETRGSMVFGRLGVQQATTHHALDDALAQATLFEKLMAHNTARSTG